MALGWGHALARTVEGKLYSWGYAANGRLGLIAACSEEPKSQNKLNLSSDTKNPESKASRFEIAEKLVLEELEKEKNPPICWKPYLVNDLNILHLVDIACGLDHSLVLCGMFYYLSISHCKEALITFIIYISINSIAFIGFVEH